MNIHKRFFTINDVNRYCFSIFYNRDKVYLLLPKIKDFFSKNDVNTFFYSFSSIQGQRINIAIDSDCPDRDFFAQEIDKYFSGILEIHPSEESSIIGHEIGRAHV